MTLTGRAIRDALAARGTALADPANEQDLQRFEGAFCVPLNAYAQHLYLTFNGFSASDERSQIHLWPLQEVLDKKPLRAEIGAQLYFAAGDFLIDSDFVMFPCETEASPVVYLYERRPIAADVPTFFEKLILPALSIFAKPARSALA